MKKVKVRFRTWYWGNYCLAPVNAILPEGFELYDEDKHGWKNSEEWILKRKPQYEERQINTLESIIKTTYIKRMIDCKR